MKVQVSLIQPGGKRKLITMDIDPSITLQELVNKVKRNETTPNQSYFLRLANNKERLDLSKKVASLNLNETSVINMDYDAPASYQPIRRQMRIPRRTDIDTDMKEPADIQQRIDTLKSLFPPDQKPDDQAIRTALENSYWNLDRAVDYLLPTTEKNEDPLTAKDKENIVQLKSMGYSAEDAIQVYFACDRNMENTIKLIQSMNDSEVNKS